MRPAASASPEKSLQVNIVRAHPDPPESAQEGGQPPVSTFPQVSGRLQWLQPHGVLCGPCASQSEATRRVSGRFPPVCAVFSGPVTLSENAPQCTGAVPASGHGYSRQTPSHIHAALTELQPPTAGRGERECGLSRQWGVFGN